MKYLSCITNSELDIIKQKIENLYNKKQPIVVTFKKSKTNIHSYRVTIEGVFQKFFTVKDDKLKANFTIQFFDIIAGTVTISKIDEKEGV